MGHSRGELWWLYDTQRTLDRPRRSSSVTTSTSAPSSESSSERNTSFQVRFLPLILVSVFPPKGEVGEAPPFLLCVHAAQVYMS